MSGTPAVNGGLSRPVRAAGRELTMPPETRSPYLKTSPPRGDRPDRRRGDGGFDLYVIAMLALGNAVAATFVLKTAINLLL